MPNFDYGNARLLAAKSRLLPRQRLEQLAGLDSVGALLDELADTPYDRFIDAALLRAGSLAAANRMLTEAQITAADKLRRFYDGSALQQLNLWLRRYDVQNLKAVLRGAARNAPPHEIKRALFPAGELSEPLLTDLIEQPGPGEVIDRVATLGLPFAQPLIRARAEHGLESLPALEMILDRWYFADAAERLARMRSADRLREAFALEADVINLTTVLHVVEAELSLSAWCSRLDMDETDELFVELGHVSFAKLRTAAADATPGAVVEALSETRYGDALREGLRIYRDGGGYGAFEAALDGYRLRRLAAQIRTDRLGISVPLGVLALQFNEVRNLRWIANGIYIGLPRERIIDRMEFAP